MLRDYQASALVKISQAWKGGARSVLYVLPTGGGKTKVGVEAIKKGVQRGRKILWIAHRRELIKQASERMTLEGVDHGVILPGIKPSPEKSVQVCSVNTLRARKKFPPCDLIVWDESHHVASATWGHLKEQYPDTFHLGLTATPERGDRLPLGDSFDVLIPGPSVSDLIHKGYLVPCDVISPEKAIQRGQTIAEDPVQAYLKHARRSLAVVYCHNLQHAEEVCSNFNKVGINTACVHFNLTPKIREKYLSQLREGTLQAVTNVTLLTEGWDLPSLETCIIARKVGVPGLYLQMIGRVLRPSPNKQRALVLDLGGSIHHHGHPEAEREYSLDGDGISLNIPNSVKVCRMCGVCVKAYPCHRCGYEPTKKKVNIEKQKLMLFGRSATPIQREQQLSNLTKSAIRRGFLPGWVFKTYEKLFGDTLGHAEYANIKHKIEASQAWQDKRKERGFLTSPDPGSVRERYFHLPLAK